MYNNWRYNAGLCTIVCLSICGCLFTKKNFRNCQVVDAWLHYTWPLAISTITPAFFSQLRLTCSVHGIPLDMYIGTWLSIIVSIIGRLHRQCWHGIVEQVKHYSPLSTGNNLTSVEMEQFYCKLIFIATQVATTDSKKYSIKRSQQVVIQQVMLQNLSYFAIPYHCRECVM